MFKDKNIILGITGGIAAYKSAEICRRLKKLGANVIVVMTRAGAKFITPLTMETLSENEVVTELFPENKVVKTRHIDLATWADLVLIAPATANIIGKIASGIADDILSTVVMSTLSPVLLCPSMNENMYLNPIVQKNIQKLKDLGYKFIEPGIGDLACGTVGKGRLADLDIILREVTNILVKKKDLEEKRILITAGPTQEPIDKVRFLSNRSSGKMGYALALEAKKRGAKAILISGPTGIDKPQGIDFYQVKTAQEMHSQVKFHLKKADVLIMAAAVSDFVPKIVQSQKIKREEKKISLELEPTADILKEIGKNKKDKLLVGFALETENEVENAKRKLKEKNLDLIVVNNPNVIAMNIPNTK
ncbi:MAG: bifunctional phosphopantothenoylcysteine decarboxylase/phosphopantothenate--cysteine ligase CoaBC [candidate division Zixibacteria bacterium]|nr:bifunctional phosphopantothenoylcysteine decarboxylase/phosphopantothenate--cysteine ligase CoaBC [candidate division Zixibacteria bacterium]